MFVVYRENLTRGRFCEVGFDDREYSFLIWPDCAREVG